MLVDHVSNLPPSLKSVLFFFETENRYKEGSQFTRSAWVIVKKKATRMAAEQKLKSTASGGLDRELKQNWRL